MRKCIGILMVVGFFGAMFAAIAITEGFLVAIGAFGGAAIGMAWIWAAVNLME